MKATRVGTEFEFVLAIAMLLTGGISAWADTVQLNPSKDNTLYEDDTGGTTSNGQGQHFFVGRISQGLRRRGLIAFDIAGSVPAGAMIESVTLTLHASSNRGTSEIQIDLHAACEDWGEGPSVADGEEGRGALAEPGDGTWTDAFYPDQPWASEGGEFSPRVTASAAVSPVGFFDWDSSFDPGMASDVQQWLDQPETNFGWVLVASDEYFENSAKRFDTRENVEPSYWPVLTVTYSLLGGTVPQNAGAVTPANAAELAETAAN